MKMIGMSTRSPAIWLCRSRPLRSGRLTSRIRQLGVRTLGCARKSCAEGKDSACQPSVLISASSDSRTETSSSTTNTVGVWCDNVGSLTQEFVALVHPQLCNVIAVFLRRLQGHAERVEQRRLAEGLEQASDGAPFQQPRSAAALGMGGDEYDGHAEPAPP